MSELSEKLVSISSIKNQIQTILDDKGLLPVAGYAFKSTFEQFPKAIRDALEDVITIPSGTRFAYSSWDSIPGFVAQYIRGSNRPLTYMFSNCNGLVTVGSTLEHLVVNTSDATGLFSNCGMLTSAYIESEGTIVNSWAYAFSECSKLSHVELFNAGQANNYAGMFQGCTSITTAPTIVLQGDCSSMFERCTSLTNIEAIRLSSYTERIVTADHMFSFSGISAFPDLTLTSCQTAIGMFDAGEAAADSYSNLISVGTLSTPSVVDASYMFRGQKNLVTIQGLNLINIKSGGAKGIFTRCDNLENLTLINLNKGDYQTNDWDFSGAGKWNNSTLWESLYTNSGRSTSRTNVKLSLYAFNLLSLQQIEDLKTQRNIYVHT